MTIFLTVSTNTRRSKSTRPSLRNRTSLVLGTVGRWPSKGKSSVRDCATWSVAAKPIGVLRSNSSHARSWSPDAASVPDFRWFSEAICQADNHSRNQSTHRWYHGYSDRDAVVQRNLNRRGYCNDLRLSDVVAGTLWKVIFSPASKSPAVRWPVSKVSSVVPAHMFPSMKWSTNKKKTPSQTKFSSGSRKIL